MVSVKRNRLYGGRVPRNEPRQERIRESSTKKKKKRERPSPHVKVITQSKALTQHFS